MRRRNLILGGVVVATILALGIGQARLEAVAAAQQGQVQGPIFEVDPFWPKPLPNGWIMGTAIGVGVDSRDHVFLVHRGNILTREAGAQLDPPVSECCTAAPPLLEFDPQGNLVNAWGGDVEGAPYTWPSSNHGIGIDLADNIWIGGNGQGDSHVLVFTRGGQYLRTFGEPSQGIDSHAMNHFGRVAKVAFDFPNNEAYFADGYGNRRVAVVNMDSGEIVRYWGAYGNSPIDGYEYTDNRAVGQNWSADQNPQQQFRTPVHCAEPSLDGLIYVCDRPNNRIQVFNRDGDFVTEHFYAPETLGDGAVWEIAFSRDPEQRYLYLADGKNSRIRIIERASLQEISTLGIGGRYPGQFQAVHSIATDSQGNIFITETYEGRRIQKFSYRGFGPTSRHQGATWPRR